MPIHSDTTRPLSQRLRAVVLSGAAFCAALLNFLCSNGLAQVSVTVDRDSIRVATPTSDRQASPVLPPPPSDADFAQQTAASAPIAFPAEHHRWARFEPGAWRTVRITTESFDAAGKLLGRSETTQTDTLIDVSDNHYGLETTNIVHVGGKQLRGAAQQTTRNFLADTVGKLVESTELPQANLKMAERLVPCQRLELVFEVAGQRRQETIFYSPDVSPYILRREIVATPQPESDSAEISVQPIATEVAPPTPLEQTTIAVVHVDVPVTVEDQLVPGCNATVHKQSGNHQTESLEVWSDIAPGGLISASSIERDANGRRVRWTSKELVEFGQVGQSATPETKRRRWRLFRRNDG